LQRCTGAAEAGRNDQKRVATSRTGKTKNP
jgi:hypothetical protein